MSIASQLSFSTATSVLAGTAGALLYQSAANTTAFLTIGTNGYVLTSNGSVPGWSLASGITSGASTQVQTAIATTSANYFPTFVDSNNLTATAETVYTTSTFTINPSTGFVGIGSQDGSSPLNVKALSTLTGAINSFQKIFTTQASGGLGNNVYVSEWRRRRAAGTDWTTQNVHDGIWVDASFTTPGTDTRTWWERDPNTPSQAWGDSATTWMFVNGTGLGIGTTSPTVKLDVKDAITNGYTPSLRITRTSSTLNDQFLAFYNGLTTDGQIGRLKNSDDLLFGFNSGSAFGEKMRLDTSGNLMIGATSVYGGGAQEGKLTIVGGAPTADITRGNIVLMDNRAYNIPPLFTIMMGGQYNSASATTQFSGIGGGKENATDGDSAGFLAFYTRVNSGSRTERMRITSDGTVGIGETSPLTYATTGSLVITNTTFRPEVSLRTNAAIGGTTAIKLGVTASIPQGGAVISSYLSAVSGQPTDMIFSVVTSGALTERLRITSAGGLAINGSTSYGNSGDVLKSNGNAAPTWVAPSTLASASATNADNIKTILQTGNASYYPVFVSANNAVAAYMPEYTTSSFNINPSTGNVSIGTTVAPGANGRGITIYTSDYPRLSFRNSTTGDATTDGSQLLVSGSDFYIQNQEAGALIFNTTSIERMRITAGGYIGIGNIASPGTLLSNTATRHGNADGLSAHLNAKQWEVNGQGYSSVVSNISAASANVNGGLLVKLGSTDVTDKILDLESGGVNRVRVLGNGNVGIGTGATAPAYKLEVNGSFAATTKSFVIDHPTKPGMKLRYGSLEGPENGVYVRGKLTGTNTIELPEYWTKLVDPDSITVSLTSIGKHQDLYVADIADNVVTVGNGNILNKAINCFYVVYGERCDVDKLVVEI